MQLVLLLHEGHDLRLHAAQGDFQVQEEQFTQLLLQLRAVGGVEELKLDLLVQLLEGGTDLVGVVVLLVVELVPGVDGVADVGQAQVGAELLLQGLEVHVGVHLLLGAGGGGQPLEDRFTVFPDLLEVGPGIGHFTKFHGGTPFVFGHLHYSRFLPRVQYFSRDFNVMEPVFYKRLLWA